jgi:hypothetical protein
MTKPKEAITDLWENTFFKEHRTTEEVKNQAFQVHECTCSNWSALLSDCDFLRKEKGKWIQKHKSEKRENGIIHVTGDKPWSDRNEKFVNLINQLKGELLIIDPYYGLDTLHLLSKFPQKQIKLITSKLGSDEKEELIKKEVVRFKKEFKNINVKIYPKFYELHDRYIISENYFVIIGHGLKDLGNKECFMIAMPVEKVRDIVLSLKEKFEEKWALSQILV